MTTTLATKNDTHRPTRFNTELFRKETYCHGHWWAGDTCLYGAHSLVEITPHTEDDLFFGTSNDTEKYAQDIEHVNESVAEVFAAQVPEAIHDGYYTVLCAL